MTKYKPLYFKKVCHPGHGFGASFNTLLTALHFYELGIFSGVEADYKKTGNYYDPKYGYNWWEYYFEPIKVGSPDGAHVLEYHWFPGAEIVGLKGETKEENHKILRKYIKVKDHILKKVDNYIDQHFKNEFVVGAFYRGTSARSGAEASLISYQEFSDKFSDILNERGISPNQCIIFIESDEEGFIDHMKSRFPRVIYQTNEMRSKDRGEPIHVNHPNPYDMGEMTVINCLLFSKTNLIIKTQSNMIELASHFNPNIDDIALNTMNIIPHQDPRPLYKELKQKIQQGYHPTETYINSFSRNQHSFFRKTYENIQ